MSVALVASGLLALLVPGLYMYAASTAAARFPTPRNKRICLLIAHPDDEAMFFAPTVLALTRPETGNHVKILCLSSGNADGLGETRKKELVKSGMLLGLRHEDDVFVLDSPAFPDSMTTTWDPTAISDLLTSAFCPDAGRAEPTATIDVLITFDSHGVSSHPNHISLYHGARAFTSSLRRGSNPSPVALYSLTSVSFMRKYTSVLDGLATLALAWGSGGEAAPAPQGEAPRPQPEKMFHPQGLVFMNSLTGGGAGSGSNVATAWRAMTEAHKSQMAWFRYGWITFSRYMVVNDLRLETDE